MSTYDRSFIRVPSMAGATDGPYSVHFLRDTALNLNVLKGRVCRPTLVNDCYAGSMDGNWDAYIAYGTPADPGTELIAYAAGRGPFAPDYTVLRGHLLGECVAGSGPSVAATKASFRVWSDDRPYDGTFGPNAQSALVEITKAAGRQGAAFANLTCVRSTTGPYAWRTFITVTAWTDGAAGAGGKPPVEDYATLYGLQVYASLATEPMPLTL